MKSSAVRSLIIISLTALTLSACSKKTNDDGTNDPGNDDQSTTGGTIGGSTGSTTGGSTGSTTGGSTGSTTGGSTGSTTGGSTGSTTGGSTGSTTGGSTGSTTGGSTGSTTGGSTGSTTGGSTGSTTGGSTGSTTGGSTGSTTGGSTGGGTPCSPSAGTNVPGTISINSGAASTKTAAVTLSLDRNEALEMKITNDANCGCGTWETYSPSKAYTLSALNQSSSVSVQFKDYDNIISKCASASIVHDDKAPELTLTLDPANTYIANKPTKVDFGIKDTGVGLGSYSCKLNNVASSCALGAGSDSGSQVIAGLTEGNYTFELTASDSLGNSVSKSVSWTMTPAYQQIRQSYAVTANNKADILMVIDNSASMAFEQKNMAQRMSTFVNQLKGLDWRISVTTTDPSHSSLGDGRLIKMTGLKNTYYVTSQMDPAVAQKVIGDTLQRPETGSSEEQGIKVTYRAVERAVANGSSENKNFFRSDAAFATVLISDEDESKNEEKNQPANLLKYVKSTWANKAFVYHSIISKPEDKVCMSTNGAAYGVKYAELSKLTGSGTVGGAIIGSVCENDYSSQLTGIADSIQELNKVILLQCSPIGNPASSVLIKLNGSNYAGSYEVQGTRMIFDSNLPAGNYELSYQCL